MAKSNSFNKREVEKRKQEKRKEKQQRKEERKNNPASSFEDMIAYVDENGVISDTPPDLTNKNTIDIEDIEISIPKKTEVEAEEDFTGRVEYFDQTKGFGFIKDKASVNKYFFHKSNAEADIKENNIVSFKLERGTRGMNAIDVKVVK